MREKTNFLTDEQRKAFASEMKRLREGANMSTTEFSKYLGVSQPYISNIECMNRTPSMPLMEKIAGAFDTTVDAMLAPVDDRVIEFRRKYGAMLKAHREAKGLPCRVIAGALGVPPQVYKEWEQGLCSITDYQKEMLDKLLAIGEKPKVETVEVVVEAPAEIPTGICDIILAHVKDLQISEDEQKEVWRYFSKVRLYAEERKLFG